MYRANIFAPNVAARAICVRPASLSSRGSRDGACRRDGSATQRRSVFGHLALQVGGAAACQVHVEAGRLAGGFDASAAGGPELQCLGRKSPQIEIARATEHDLQRVRLQTLARRVAGAADRQGLQVDQGDCHRHLAARGEAGSALAIDFQRGQVAGIDHTGLDQRQQVVVGTHRHAFTRALAQHQVHRASPRDGPKASNRSRLGPDDSRADHRVESGQTGLGLRRQRRQGGRHAQCSGSEHP